MTRLSLSTRWSLSCAILLCGLLAVPITSVLDSTVEAQSWKPKCFPYATPSCPTCDDDAETGCVILDDWTWGYCNVDPNGDVCEERTTSCTDNFDCATGDYLGPCSVHGNFGTCNG